MAAKGTEKERASRAPESVESFEGATQKLAKIVGELERGDLTLERSLELFEEGVRVARTAQARIDHAERRLEELLGVDAEGRPVVKPLIEEGE